MIEIKTQGEPLDLSAGFSIEIEDSNPVFNDRGSQSIPATIPATRRNIRLLDAPHRIDAGVNPNIPEISAEVVEGAYIRRGTMNITEAGKNEGITFNIGFDNSTVYAGWSQKKLSEMEGLPVYRPQLHGEGRYIDDILEDLYRIYQSADPAQDDMAVFPVAVSNESTGTDGEETTCWEVLNLPGPDGLSQPRKVKRIIDSEITEVNVPEGYMVSPFLRVWRVLDLIFGDIGVNVLDNPFRSDPELSRLVILNNTADAVCAGKVEYSDLMPDCTVEEFLNALWVRFGFVYNIDNNTGTVSMAFIKDIIDTAPLGTIDVFATGHELIKYNSPQYIRLNAATSIEGAAPVTDRFEDFVKGLDISDIHMGADIRQWRYMDQENNPYWDGDWMDWDDYDPREDPDWEYPDPDDRDDDREGPYYLAPGRVRSAGKEGTGSFLAREFITGQWYLLDDCNGTVRETSSSFFMWDPKPDGLTSLELTSVDECVPVGRVSTVGLGTGHDFNGYCPLYLTGARHYHSYIKGNEGSDGNTTPLAFMFAYTTGHRTVGRLNPEGEDGKVMTLDDGTRPTLSLLFQFKDGLFAKFWARFDEILRHGNRTVEVNTRLLKSSLSGLDMLKPYTFKGVRVMIDTLNYSLPSGREVSVDMTLRTVQTMGAYDIETEQNIPPFASAARHLEWFLYSESYGPELDNQNTRSQAALKYIEENHYTSHGDSYIDKESAVLKRMIRLNPTWRIDKTLPAPGDQGQSNRRIYRAYLTYDIYEMNYNGSTVPVRSDVPIGTVSVTVDYTVILFSKWVSD